MRDAATLRVRWIRVDNFADGAGCVFAEVIVEGQQAFLGQIMVSRPQFLDS